MRFTDLILTLPGLAVLLTAAVYLGSNDSEVAIGPITVTIPQPMKIGLILALLLWVTLARIVRGLFLSLREKEFVEAAKAAGASDMRIISRHILPNCIGPIVVYTTLITAAAILIEATLSFLGLGIQPPNAALGKLIVDGQSEGLRALVARRLPGPRHHAHRARDQLHRRRPSRRPRPDAAANPLEHSCPNRSSRSAI